MPGTTDIFDFIPVPGDVLDEGTLLNKANLLSDETAAELGLEQDDPTVDDAFHIIHSKTYASDSTAAAFGLSAGASVDEVLAKAAQKVNIIAGAYTGNGAASRVISLGATPKALLLFSSGGISTGLDASYGGLALPGHPVVFLSYTVCEIVNNGFKVYYKVDHVYSNNSGSTCHYLALV